jgi:CHAT domain-containing protein/tetratricopeptide (TPR) repeat protein
MTCADRTPALLLERLDGLDPAEALGCLRAQQRPAEALIALAEDAERLAIDDLGRADRSTRLLVRLADELADSRCRIRARRARAQSLAYACRFDESLAVLGEALELARVEGEPVEAARMRMTRLHALAKLGRYDEAIAEGETAHRTFLDAGAHDLAARADINLGVTHRMKGDPQRAIAHFDRAQARVAEQPLLNAQLESNRAEALLDLSRFHEAERSFGAALAAFERLGAPLAAAIVEGNLGDLMSRQGRFESGLYHFEQARRRLLGEGSSGELARLKSEQAEAFAAAGLLDEALDTYCEALPELERNGLAWYAARARAGLGRALLESGRHAEAAAALAEAGRRFTDLGHTAGSLKVAVLDGVAAMHAGDLPRARRVLEAVLPRLGDHPADAATARLHLAQAHLDAGDVSGAEAHLDAGLHLARLHALVPHVVDLLHLRGRARLARGDLVAAARDLRDAAELIEGIRGRLRSDRFRRAFFGGRVSVYDDLVGALVAAGDGAGAFSAVERSRSRALLDLLDGGIQLVDHLRRHAADAAEAALLEEMVEVQGAITARHHRFDSLEETPAPGPAPADAQPDGLERRLRVLESRLAATRPVGEVFAAPLDLPSAQRLLSPDTALVEYFQAGSSLVAFVVRSDRFQLVAPLAPACEVEEHVERFRFQVGRALGRLAQGSAVDAKLEDDARHELKWLHGRLIAPLAEGISGAARLVVVPHGALHSLPFHALHDGTGHLVERFEVIRAPSASAFARVRGRGRSAPRPGRLVVGVPDPAAPAIPREIAAATAAMPGATALVGEAATGRRVAAEAERSGIIHLACHGRFSQADPLASGLRLADGWLTVRDLFALRIEGAVLVLSGCETGGAAVESGDELMGLVRPLLAAGAATIVASLWTVSDESTAILMETLYHSWQNDPGGAGVGPALREAQRRMLARRPHPAHWAPFVVIGGG